MGLFSKTRKGYLILTDWTENAVPFKFVFFIKAKSGQVDTTKIIFKVERFI